MSTEALLGLSLRVAACRYAAVVADDTTTDAERAKAWADLERAAAEHVGLAVTQEIAGALKSVGGGR